MAYNEIGMVASPDENLKTAKPPQSSLRLFSTVVIGVLLGASLGPAPFFLLKYLELSGDSLLAFVVGSFVAIGICLVVAGVAALLIVPRIFANVVGTLTGMVKNIVEASRAHVRGEPDEAIQFAGRAVEEGVAWFSIGTTRRFIAQSALGLLLSFGGIVGAVLLFSQNTLLREQNLMIKSQVGLLGQQNAKVDEQLALLVAQNSMTAQQLKLLSDQNGKIDQQTMVTDAQKRGAFSSELFSIVQEVARQQNGEKLNSETIARIVVLTSSAAPYVYLDFLSDADGSGPKRIRKPLSPERGQILVALARMKVDLHSLATEGARFENADLRGADLDDANLSRLNLSGSDFTRARLKGTRFQLATLSAVDFTNAEAFRVTFQGASIAHTNFFGSNLMGVNFQDAYLEDLVFHRCNIERASFDKVKPLSVSFDEVAVGDDPSKFPRGLDFPQSIHDHLLKQIEEEKKKDMDKRQPATLSYKLPAIDLLKPPNSAPQPSSPRK